MLELSNCYRTVFRSPHESTAVVGQTEYDDLLSLTRSLDSFRCSLITTREESAFPARCFGVRMKHRMGLQSMSIQLHPQSCHALFTRERQLYLAFWKGVEDGIGSSHGMAEKDKQPFSQLAFPFDRRSKSKIQIPTPRVEDPSRSSANRIRPQSRTV